MLSKNNKILVGCLALLLVMSVGYALFSDTITINGTATAKGEFDIEVTCAPDITDELGTALIAQGASETDITNIKSVQNSYENDACTVVNNEVNYSVGLLAPSAERYFTIKVTNTGSIPVNLSNIERGTRTYTGGITLTDGTIKEVKDFSSGAKEAILFEVPSLVAWDIKNFTGDVTGYEDLVLNTGDSLYFLVDARLPEDFFMGSSLYGTTYTSMDFSVSAIDKFTFTQATN